MDNLWVGHYHVMLPFVALGLLRFQQLRSELICTYLMSDLGCCWMIHKKLWMCDRVPRECSFHNSPQILQVTWSTYTRARSIFYN